MTIYTLTMTEDYKIWKQLLDYGVFNELLKFLYSEDREILINVLKALRTILAFFQLSQFRTLEKLEEFDSVRRLHELCLHPDETIAISAFSLLNMI